jgi:bifunctional DNA-binding transcriptional regulator/antitoxin component of YhaV-PrlF toxin-antitoxin module
MTTVRLSPDYSVVLPPEVRSEDLKPGQRLRIRRDGERIEITLPASATVRRAARHDDAALVARDRAGYRRKPDHRDAELTGWERVQAWPED